MYPVGCTPKATTQGSGESGPTVPSNNTAPVIVSDGDLANPEEGDVLSLSVPGVWSGDPVPTLSYNWRHQSDFLDIPGETATAYTVQAGDKADHLYLRETATNIAGSASVDSNVSGEVLGPPDAISGITLTPEDRSMLVEWDLQAGAQYIVWYASVNDFGSASSIGTYAIGTDSLDVSMADLSLSDGDLATTGYWWVQGTNAQGYGPEGSSHAATWTGAEKTTIQTVADVDASLHGKQFSLYGSSSNPLAVKLSAGATSQVTSLDFTGLTDATFTTGGAGKYFTLPIKISGVTADHYFWYNTGTESDPGGSGTGHEVVIPTATNGATIASVTNSVLPAGVSGGLVDAVLTITNIETGSVTAADPGTMPSIMSVFTGRNAVSGSNVSYSPNDTAAAIATAVAAGIAANNGGQWSLVTVSDTITVTDLTLGVRTNAADVDTGFTVTVTQPGG